MNVPQKTTGGCGGACQCVGQAQAPVPAINGIALLAPGENRTPEELRERAWAELLRQEAVRRGLLPRVNVLQAPELGEAGQAVVQEMVDAEVPMQHPTEEECRRYYEGHKERFVEGAQALVRHILFAVTERVDVPALAARAEKALLELTDKAAAPTRFGELARELSNCPSGAAGGELGWLVPHDLADELAHELFFQPGALLHTGMKPRLVHSRYGFHILDVQARRGGKQLPFEQVRTRIATVLSQQNRARALHQYIRVLAGRSLVEGVELEAAESPLVQ